MTVGETKAKGDQARGGLAAEEKAKHSIFYSTCTSEIKDDLPALVSCVKSGTGQLSRQEAIFLLWHHVLLDSSFSDAHEELLGLNLVGCCLALLESLETSNVEKTSAIGLLHAFARVDECREGIARGKTAGLACVAVLEHCSAPEVIDSIRQHALGTLRQLVQNSTVRTMIMKQWEQRLPFALFKANLAGRQADHVVAHVCGILTELLAKRDDLKEQAGAAGLVPLVLGQLQRTKAFPVAEGIAALMASMVEVKENIKPFLEAGAIRMMVDLLGPPPDSVMAYEKLYHKQPPPPPSAVPSSPNSGRDESRLRGFRGSSKLGSDSMGQAGSQTALPGMPTLREGSITVIPGVSSPTGSPSTSPHKPLGSRPTLSRGEMVAAAAPPPPPPPVPDVLLPIPETGLPPPPPVPDVLLPIPEDGLLHENSVGIKWQHQHCTLGTLAHATGCLYTLVQHEPYLRQISERLTAHRLVPVIKRCLQADEPKGGAKKAGAKKKSKKLVLDKEQEEVLLGALGILKFLSTLNINRYRIATLGALPPLLLLHDQASRLLLRRNAQVVLENVAMLAENSKALEEAKMPASLTTEFPMKLNEAEIEQLLVEFPAAGLKRLSEQTAAARM